MLLSLRRKVTPSGLCLVLGWLAAELFEMRSEFAESALLHLSLVLGNVFLGRVPGWMYIPTPR